MTKDTLNSGCPHGPRPLFSPENHGDLEDIRPVALMLAGLLGAEKEKAEHLEHVFAGKSERVSGRPGSSGGYQADRHTITGLWPESSPGRCWRI